MTQIMKIMKYSLESSDPLLSKYRSTTHGNELSFEFDKKLNQLWLSKLEKELNFDENAIKGWR